MFKDPVSTFAYNLISLHHDIMWYIILILTLVYWCLYKTLKEYSWNVFNKQEGLLIHVFNHEKIYKVQKLIFYIWITIYIYNIAYFCIKIGHILAKKIDKKWLKKSNKVAIYLLGKPYYLGLTTAYGEEEYLEDLSCLGWDNYNNVILERVFSYYFFNKTGNAIFFYEGTDKILNTLKFKHSINLEYVFGLFPTIIIALIIVPSMYLLYSNETDINPCITIKIIGHQWYWSYESNSANYVKNTQEILYLNYNYESIIIDENELKNGRRRLLETDNSLVLPYNVVLRFLITSADVLHSWALPEMGIKVDAVPGRLNQAITIPSNLGIFYGQCSEICGVSHGFMPIKVNVLSLSDYHNLLLHI